MTLSKAYMTIVRDTLTCPLCLEVFDAERKKPKALPCIHTMCLSCLEGYIKKHLEENYMCPVCQGTFIVPAGGVSCFPTNTTVIGMLDLLQQEETIGDENEAKPTDTSSSSAVKPKCTSHTTFEYSMFCNDCNEPLCIKCMTTTKTHHGHDLEDIDTLYLKRKDELAGASLKLKKILNDHNAFVKETLSTVQHRKTLMKAKLREKIQEEAQIAQEKGETEIDVLFTGALKKFDEFTLDFTTQHRKADSMLLELGTDFGVISCQHEQINTIQSSIESLLDLQAKKDTVIPKSHLDGLLEDFSFESLFGACSRNATVLEASSQKEIATAFVSVTEPVGVTSSQTMTEECIMLSDIGNVTENTVIMPFVINDFRTFLKRPNCSPLYSQHWYVRGAPWKVITQLKLPRDDDDNYPNKTMPVMYLGVDCDRRGSNWNFEVKYIYKLFDFDMNTYVVEFVDTVEFNTKSPGWGFTLDTKETISQPGYEFVKDNSMRILVTLTVL